MQHFRTGTATIVYYVFDTLRLNGADLMTVAATERKRRLAVRLPTEGTVQYAAHIEGPDRPLQRRAHWVHPRLVGEVMFTEWTHDNTLRHPSFQGLRRDKKAREVRRE
jgi:ATP-dependent DNA ligase